MGASGFYLFFVLWAANPGNGYPIPLAQGPTNETDVLEFVLDTDYRDYNTSVDHTRYEVLHESGKITEINAPQTEILCVRTTVKQGTNILLTINIVMARNGTILKPPTVSSAANPINKYDGCQEILTSVGDDYDFIDFCEDLALVCFPLCLFLLLAVKIRNWLRAVKEVSSEVRMRTMSSGCRGYVTVPRTPPPSYQECSSVTACT